MDKKSVVLSHPTGNANMRALVNLLAENGQLLEFYTTVASFPDNIWNGLSKYGVFRDFKRRSYLPIIKGYTYQRPWKELGRLIANKIGLNSLVDHEVGVFSVDAVYRDLDKYVATQLSDTKKKGGQIVYAYEDGALQTFRKAKDLGLTCVYELPIAYWQTGKELMEKEAERLPEWAFTLGGGIHDSEEKLQRKTEELKLADIIVGPGNFVINSLPIWAKNKKTIISPFGSPEFIWSNSRTQRLNDTLRVLFVGSMGQRKGLADLFSAIKLLNRKDIELVVLGSLRAPMSFYREQLDNFVYENGRPHDEVLELMQTCDVLCLPSIVEGRALVMQEAMSQGLPLIVTPNTGGDDLIIEGKTGFLVPIASPEKIAEKIAWFADNRNEIPIMGDSARAHAKKYTWKAYASDIIEGIEKWRST